MTHWPYLPFLLAWSLPIIVGQWIVGARYLLREWRSWSLVALALGAYFTAADAVAIQAHIWMFDRYSLVGLYIGPVPLEEVLFYLLTATMVTQGFVLFWSAWEERRSLLRGWRTRSRRLAAWVAPRRAGARHEQATPTARREPADVSDA